MLNNFNREFEFPNRLETDYFRILSYDFPQKYSDTYKSYEYTRLCTILEGEKTITVNQKDLLKYDSDMFLLMPPESNIFMKIEKPTRAVVFELSDDLIKKVSENISFDYNTDYNMLIKDRLLCLNESTELKEILGKITKSLRNNDKNVQYLIDLYAQELVYSLLQIKGTHQILNYEPENPVSKAIRYMKDEYAGPISIRQISKNLNMSEANFCQYFKKITGVSPKEYLTKIKMEKAKNMIAHESVTDTAFDLGYENISHFISTFKDQYGMTPKQYKKKCE